MDPKFQINPGLCGAESAIRIITAAKNERDRQRVTNQLFGKPGSEKRKSVPTSLRRKVFKAISSENKVQSGIPLSPEVIGLRETLRRIVASPLANKMPAYEFMERVVDNLQNGSIFCVKDAAKEIAAVFNYYEIDPAIAFTKKYEELSYFNDKNESAKKVLYGQFIIFSNENFKVDAFIPSKTNPVELTSLLSILNPEEMRIFLETVFFNTQLNEDDIGSFIHSLVEVANGTDEGFGEEVRKAISEVSKTLVLQALHLANNEEEFSVPNFSDVSFHPDDIALLEERREKLEGEKLDECWYYERIRQEILLISIEAELFTPSQAQFELLYEAALTEEVENRIMVAMIKAAKSEEHVQDIEDFIFGKIEDTKTDDSDFVNLRKVAFASNLSMLGTDKALDFLTKSLTGNDVYFQIGAYECIACNYKNGVEVIEREARAEILKGNYKLFGIIIIGASLNEASPFIKPTQGIIKKLFQKPDINMAKVFSDMDGLSLPFDKAGNVSIDETPKSTHDFLSGLGLKFLSSLIVKSAPEVQRINASRVIKMFSESELKVFMTKPEGKGLLQRLF